MPQKLMPRFTFNTQLDEESHKRRVRLQRRLGCKGPELVKQALRALEKSLTGDGEEQPAT
jgi:hypothetical protein